MSRINTYIVLLPVFKNVCDKSHKKFFSFDWKVFKTTTRLIDGTNLKILLRRMRLKMTDSKVWTLNEMIFHIFFIQMSQNVKYTTFLLIWKRDPDHRGNVAWTTISWPSLDNRVDVTWTSRERRLTITWTSHD